MPLYRAELLAKKPLRPAVLIHDVSQVLHLPFDWDDGSYTRDRSGRAIHGTIYGAARAGGKIGMALSHDGVDDYVEVANVPELNLQEMTIVAWIFIRSQAQRWGYWFSKGGSYQYGFLFNEDDDRLYFWAVLDGVWQTLVSSAPVPHDTWINTAFSWNPTTGEAKIYVDGSLSASAIKTGTIATTTYPLRIGTRGDFLGNFFNGIIDEARAYNRALTQDEIRMLMYRRF